MIASRIVQLAADPPDADTDLKLRAFRLLLLIHLAVRMFFQIHAGIAGLPGGTSGPLDVACSLLVAGSLLILLVPRIRGWAILIAACGMLGKFAFTLPGTSNHLFFETLIVVVMALLPLQRGNQAILGETLRWIVIIVLFYTGLQKLLYGAYFGGQFFGYAISSSDPGFAPFFRPFMPAAEFERLKAIGLPTEGSGPYGVDAPLVVFMSNSAYVLEMAVAVLLLVQRTRALATIIALGMVFLIELAAREFLFGLLTVNLLLLFPARAWNHRASVAIVIPYLLFMAIHFGGVAFEFKH